MVPIQKKDKTRMHEYFHLSDGMNMCKETAPGCIFTDQTQTCVIGVTGSI